MPDEERPQWLDKVNAHTIGAFTLDDGECLTAEILDFNDETDELNVDVISSNRPDSTSRQRSRAISVRHVVSYAPRSRAEQPWPHSDICRSSSFSLARFILFATLFLCLIPGSMLAFVLMMERPYGVQEASAIIYTIFVVFFTFSVSRGLRPYMFTCPAVRTRISSLLWRHLGFLGTLFALQTAALSVRPNLPDWWEVTGRKGNPFEFVLMSLCLGLGFAQVLTNRALLDRAHREFSP